MQGHGSDGSNECRRLNRSKQTYRRVSERTSVSSAVGADICALPEAVQQRGADIGAPGVVGAAYASSDVQYPGAGCKVTGPALHQTATDGYLFDLFTF
jgi:hypothetical protein